MSGGIGTKWSTATSLSANISSAATGLTNFTTGPVEGGNTPGITEGSAAITELLQLFEVAGNIITRDAGKILQVNCALMEEDRRTAIYVSVVERMPLDISQQQ